MANMTTPKYGGLVLDIGNVLFMYSAVHVAALSFRQLKNALDSPAWYEYERGKVSKQDCDGQIAKDFGFDLNNWNDALNQLRASLQPNKDFIAAIRQLKLTYPELRVYGMTNMPKQDFEQLMPVIKNWGIFDEVYASSALGSRKPDIDSYEKFVGETNLSPEACIFVDDRLENVIAAQSFGFQALLFKDTSSTITSLHNLLGDPITRGHSYLQRNAKNLFSRITTGEIQKDNYGQLLILQCTGNRFGRSGKRGPLWNYFIGDPNFAETTYPFDSDTTALAMMVLDNVPAEEKELAMEKMLSNVSPDGLPLCWFAPSRPRICHCISANVFRFFCLNDRGHQLPTAYDFFCRLLKTKAYLLGSRYYESPDWLLFILADLCAKRPNDEGLRELSRLVNLETKDRMGCDKDILSTALRLVASQTLGLPNPRDLKTILDAQQVDGGWEKVWLWRYGKEKVKIGGGES
ncbi:Sesquiterpene cyclase astC [Cladobotryum mycophilum]|uniref:Sesquiterpene cyclase astC n=1 Tax=Cladobotryum mycophilum TaxID=491253 RepID=A0ABR0SBV2_9HYPO